MRWFGDKYAEAFWPLAVLPLAVAGAGVAVVANRSALAAVALGALAIGAALGEIVIWRGLRSKWSGEQSGLWPWSERAGNALELAALFAIMTTAGSWKVHDIEHGTWPGAVFFAWITGGLFAVLLRGAAIERHWQGRPGRN